MQQIGTAYPHVGNGHSRQCGAKRKRKLLDGSGGSNRFAEHLSRHNLGQQRLPCRVLERVC